MSATASTVNAFCNLVDKLDVSPQQKIELLNLMSACVKSATEDAFARARKAGQAAIDKALGPKASG